MKPKWGTPRNDLQSTDAADILCMLHALIYMRTRHPMQPLVNSLVLHKRLDVGDSVYRGSGRVARLWSGVVKSLVLHKKINFAESVDRGWLG